MGKDILDLLTNVTGGASVLAVLGTVLGAIGAWWSGRMRLEKLNVELTTLTVPEGRTETIVECVTRLLNVAIDRREQAMVRSERRATLLFRLGSGLMVLAVLVPFLLVLLYFQQSPSGELQGLTKLGLEPKDAVALVSRDWHLLLAGVSFGLLFLAAAKGLLSAELQQRRIHDNQQQVIEAYSDIIRGIEFAAKLDDASEEHRGRALTDAVQHTARFLLDAGARHAIKPGEPHETNGASEPELVLLKQLADGLKR